jgi:hypothetical protein
MATLTNPSIRLYSSVTASCVAARHQVRRRLAAARADDRGEGVISAAIVVLIMAALGAAMWAAFNAMWDDVRTRTENKVDEVGT